MSTLSDTARWAAYFAANATADRGIPWARGVRWAPDERRAVAASVQEFQLGEQSEGRYLRACAARHAAETGDALYAPTMDRFIAEEQRHAAELARLLALAGEPLKARTPVDTAFRLARRVRLRRSGGLEPCLRVLVSAEVIATSYYDALAGATDCPVTRALCVRILRDEAAHVRFHAERLARLSAGRPRRVQRAVEALHRLGLAAAVALVWLGPHRRVLRRGGYTYRRFLGRSQHLLTHRVLAVARLAPGRPTVAGGVSAVALDATPSRRASGSCPSRCPRESCRPR